MNRQLLIVSGMILVAAFSRFLPHPPNMTAVGAMALFAGARFPNKAWAILVPLLAMLLSDLFIGFYKSMIFTYIGFALVAVWGLALRGQRKPMAWLGGSVVASGIFYLISNIGAWWGSTFYEPTASGLAAALIAGLPFFPSTLVGDAVFTVVLFGLYQVFEKRWEFQPVSVKA